MKTGSLNRYGVLAAERGGSGGEGITDNEPSRVWLFEREREGPWVLLAGNGGGLVTLFDVSGKGLGTGDGGLEPRGCGGGGGLFVNID